VGRRGDGCLLGLPLGLLLLLLLLLGLHLLGLGLHLLHLLCSCWCSWGCRGGCGGRSRRPHLRRWPGRRRRAAGRRCPWLQPRLVLSLRRRLLLGLLLRRRQLRLPGRADDLRDVARGDRGQGVGLGCLAHPPGSGPGRAHDLGECPWPVVLGVALPARRAAALQLLLGLLLLGLLGLLGRLVGQPRPGRARPGEGHGRGGGAGLALLRPGLAAAGRLAVRAAGRAGGPGGPLAAGAGPGALLLRLGLGPVPGLPALLTLDLAAAAAAAAGARAQGASSQAAAADAGERRGAPIALLAPPDPLHVLHAAQLGALRHLAIAGAGGAGRGPGGAVDVQLRRAKAVTAQQSALRHGAARRCRARLSGFPGPQSRGQGLTLAVSERTRCSMEPLLPIALLSPPPLFMSTASAA
jgi:hypothetical protein